MPESLVPRLYRLSRQASRLRHLNWAADLEQRMWIEKREAWYRSLDAEFGPQMARREINLKIAWEWGR